MDGDNGQWKDNEIHRMEAELEHYRRECVTVKAMVQSLCDENNELRKALQSAQEYLMEFDTKELNGSTVCIACESYVDNGCEHNCPRMVLDEIIDKALRRRA